VIRAVSVIVLVACSSKPAPPPQDKPVKPPGDAGVDGITTIRGFDPTSGMHLDEDVGGRRLTEPAANRAGRPIDITLRSTPTGAAAAVDGRSLGNTPAYWFGEADGREHEFTFALAGHALARYRFVPITSGVVHARLERVTEEPDAGVAEPEAVAPPPASSAPPVPPPPPTIVSPPDAAVVIDPAAPRDPGPTP
jgi:hypothetical protein